MKQKKELRQEILQLRDALTVEERREKSHKIAEQVIKQKGFTEADKILLFASYKSEVDTSEIFFAAQKLGKEVYYPKVMGSEMEFYLVEKEDDLVEGYRGIREPQEIPSKCFVPQSNDKICIIVPGTVFDEEGNRIGYGGGYYDKYIQKLKDIWEKDKGMLERNFHTIAVAFQCQLVEADQIIKEEHDIKADVIMTEMNM